MGQSQFVFQPEEGARVRAVGGGEGDRRGAGGVPRGEDADRGGERAEEGE